MRLEHLLSREDLLPSFIGGDVRLSYFLIIIILPKAQLVMVFAIRVLVTILKKNSPVAQLVRALH